MPTLARDCAKKKRYATAAHARWAVRKLFWRTDVTDASFYHCTACNGFHVTSRPARRGNFRRF